MKKQFLLITLLFAVNCLAGPIHEAAKRGKLAEVKRLIEEEGVDIDVRDEYHKGTPLHAATFGGHRDVVEYLIEKGATFDVKNYVGMTPFDHAVRRGKKDPVILFILNGAEIDTDLIRVADYEEIQEYLKKIHDFVNANPQEQRNFIGTYFASQDYAPFIFVYAMKQAMDKILQTERPDLKSLLLYHLYVVAKNSAEKNKVKAAIVKGLKIPKRYSQDIDFDAKDFKIFLSKALQAIVATKNRMLRELQIRKAIKKLASMTWEKMKK